MVLVTAGKIINSIPVLQKLIAADVNINIAYRIAKIIDVINKEFNIISSLRLKLIKKYDYKKDDDINDDKYKLLRDDLEKLSEKEISLDIEKISLKDCNITISTQDFISIKFIIE